MIYTAYYDSPLGRMLLAANNEALTGVWFEGQKYFAETLEDNSVQGKNDIISDTGRWLDIYFSGREPDFTPVVRMKGSDFRRSVWNILMDIPYGQTVTYGEIAKMTAIKTGNKRVSAQAVGGAVGHNPISVIIPCHRVIGADGSLTGYAGGTEKKKRLLDLERTGRIQM